MLQEPEERAMPSSSAPPEANTEQSTGPCRVIYENLPQVGIGRFSFNAGKRVEPAEKKAATPVEGTEAPPDVSDAEMAAKAFLRGPAAAAAAAAEGAKKKKPRTK